MPIETTPAFVAEPAADARFVAVPFGHDLAPPTELPLPVEALLSHYEAKGDPGEVVEVPVALGSGIRRVLLYGIGRGSAADLRKAGASVARKVKGGATVYIRVPDSTDPSDTADAAALAEGALLASYTFRIGTRRTPPEIVFVGGDEKALRRGETIARATALARDLINTPASIKSPAWLAEQARSVAADAGLGFREDAALVGFGGIRAVGQGSATPPRLVELTYAPEGATRHVVLVGKGITFDTGGLSLKPEEGMKTMKTDMAGGATVIAVMGALATAGVPVRVTGLVACAENAFSGSAQRPGDVITQYGGRTVEVLNTDAEGRLVLADALAYADAELEPDIVIDIATLTGAAKVALGLRLGALYATDEPLADALLASGEASGDRLWRMPLIDDYRADLDSDIADLANVDRKMSGSAGSVAAALFLREFTGGRPWAHLDVAGPARATADDGEVTKGGTGFGVRLLLHYLTSLG
ncbi:leucyl aminopeptidase [Microtetraspora sp. NBRC 16547]|uniref:leucyl aminopeptidase n=1 Tax=Microtetraspora sp. NBRC 16547 TaxID=3030993 RepID=UPI00249FD79F|nr:leucyl aminopeptidase [Microtetraspora sp. NBRC 16547]GLW97733.1 leucyl aminopeptidase [Microtetraspora sp. NBRC 16547]